MTAIAVTIIVIETVGCIEANAMTVVKRIMV
jgi:hypothetical protein